MPDRDATRNRTVAHRPDRSRYELIEDGDVVGIADYVRTGDTMVFPHTVINRDRRGQGLGDVLVRGALDHVRQEPDVRVVPQCWFVEAFISQHPEYADLLAAPQ